MKKKGIKLITICLISLLLTGCDQKKALTNNDFKKLAEQNNYKVSDVTIQYKEYDTILNATIAQGEDWQVEFYTLTNTKNAKKMFNSNQNNFESYKENATAYKSVTAGNYTTYSLTSLGYYLYLCQIDNTLLYVRVKKTHKKKVKEFIEELGY